MPYDNNESRFRVKRFLKINKIEVYSTYNESKSDAAERFIRTLENRFLST